MADPITLGTLAAAAFKGIWDIGATVFANKYNSPAAQRRRLRKAGLPLAFMYQGRVNTQSDVPRLSIDPTLGQVQKLGLSQQNEVNQANIKKIGAEVVGIAQENLKKKGELDWLQTKNEIGESNQVQLLEIDKSRKEAERFIAEHQRELKQIAVWVENNLFKEDIQIQERKAGLEKVRQQLTNLISQDSLLRQMYDIRKIEQVVNSLIGENLEDGPAWATAIYAMLIKLYSKL